MLHQKFEINRHNLKLIYALLFFIFALDYAGFSQEIQTYRGRIIDAETDESIPFATLFLKNAERGTVTNADGDFQISSIFILPDDTLIISCIGYKNKEIPLTHFMGENIFEIRIYPKVYDIPEVVIWNRERSLSAKEIVDKALENIEFNYSYKPFLYDAYYKDYQVIDNQYVNLNEAIVEVYDRGFDTKDADSTRIELLYYRQNSDFPRNKALEITYDNLFFKYIPGAYLHPQGGNELGILRIHNAVRNYKIPAYAFVYGLKANFKMNHRFKLKTPVFLDNKKLYHIEFQTTYSSAGPWYFGDGRIYISEDNFAIHQMEYSLYLKSLFRNKLLMNVFVEYSQHDSMMYLNYISTNNIFKVQDSKNFKVEKVLFDVNDYILSIKFNSQPIIETASNTDKYKIEIDNTRLIINEIHFDEKSNTVNIQLDRDQMEEFDLSKENLNDRIRIDFRRIKNTEGRVLGQISYVQVEQYRELFVQKIKSINEIESDTLYMDMSKPLDQNPLSPEIETQDYWLNTPFKKTLFRY